MAGALIVTAEFGPADFALLNGLRQQYFPADRNVLPAHLTMFHAIPPSAEAELRGRLKHYASEPRPEAHIVGLMNLGGGVAFRVVSDKLDAIRAGLANGLHGLLSAQDSGGWRPHVTIQNKVPARTALALLQTLERSFEPRPLTVTGLGLHRYLGGPWERLAIYSFRGG